MKKEYQDREELSQFAKEIFGEHDENTKEDVAEILDGFRFTVKESEQ